MIHCINCGHVNAEGATQCEACFEPLPAVTSCPTCQAAVPDEAYFCPQCGASLPRGVASQSDPPLPTDEGTPQPPSDLPPTNVVAQQSFDRAAQSPIHAVQPPDPIELPPTYVINPQAASELPPTHVVNPLPETLPPQAPPNIPSDIPPTNVVNPLSQDSAPVDSPGQALDSDEPPSIETVPTMVVSPNSESDVVDTPLPLPDPTVPPQVPPTVPPQVSPPLSPQAPPSYQAPESIAPVESSATDMPFPQVGGESPIADTFAAPITETMDDEGPAPPQFEASAPLPTTVQPSSPTVGETVIQKPVARLLHERTNTSLTLPSSRELILIGKKTSSISPDVDVSGFMDSDVVSRRHAAIFAMPDGYFIEDLGSSNGTYVNDLPCPQGDRISINPGDRICLGRENKVSFIFQIG